MGGDLITVLGKVEKIEPPYLVLSLTMEPTKPRLCHDAHFLNLWMVDSDSLIHLPGYVGRNTYKWGCDIAMTEALPFNKVLLCLIL